MLEVRKWGGQVNYTFVKICKFKDKYKDGLWTSLVIPKRSYYARGRVRGWAFYRKLFCPPLGRDEVLIFSGGGAASRRLPRICGTQVQSCSTKSWGQVHWQELIVTFSWIFFSWLILRLWQVFYSESKGSCPLNVLWKIMLERNVFLTQTLCLSMIQCTMG